MRPESFNNSAHIKVDGDNEKNDEVVRRGSATWTWCSGMSDGGSVNNDSDYEDDEGEVWNSMQVLSADDSTADGSKEDEFNQNDADYEEPMPTENIDDSAHQEQVDNHEKNVRRGSATWTWSSGNSDGGIEDGDDYDDDDDDEENVWSSMKILQVDDSKKDEISQSDDNEEAKAQTDTDNAASLPDEITIEIEDEEAQKPESQPNEIAIEMEEEEEVVGDVQTPVVREKEAEVVGDVQKPPLSPGLLSPGSLMGRARLLAKSKMNSLRQLLSQSEEVPVEDSDEVQTKGKKNKYGSRDAPLSPGTLFAPQDRARLVVSKKDRIKQKQAASKTRSSINQILGTEEITQESDEAQKPKRRDQKAKRNDSKKSKKSKYVTKDAPLSPGTLFAPFDRARLAMFKKDQIKKKNSVSNRHQSSVNEMLGKNGDSDEVQNPDRKESKKSKYGVKDAPLSPGTLFAPLDRARLVVSKKDKIKQKRAAGKGLQGSVDKSLGKARC